MLLNVSVATRKKKNITIQILDIIFFQKKKKLLNILY